MPVPKARSSEKCHLKAVIVQIGGGTAVYPGSFTIPFARFPTADIEGILDFLVDRTELTNKDFKQVVDAGGHSDPEWWTNPFETEG